MICLKGLDSYRRVDPHSFIFLLKGTLTYDRILPYNKELLEPQRDLLTYIMKQLYSKELVMFLLTNDRSFHCPYLNLGLTSSCSKIKWNFLKLSTKILGLYDTFTPEAFDAFIAHIYIMHKFHSKMMTKYTWTEILWQKSYANTGIWTHHLLTHFHLYLDWHLLDRSLVPIGSLSSEGPSSSHHKTLTEVTSHWQPYPEPVVASVQRFNLQPWASRKSTSQINLTALSNLWQHC